MKIVDLSVKQDLPTVEKARARLVEGLKRLAGEGVTFVRVVHGYGSKGVGGKIRHAIVPTLRRLQSEGVIRVFIPGEHWKPGNAEADRLVRATRGLREDPDFGGSNKGITIVVIAPRVRKQPRAGYVDRSSRASKSAKHQEDATADNLERLLESDPEQLYDQFSKPHMIRRLKPED
jgi:hypothetical protein